AARRRGASDVPARRERRCTVDPRLPGALRLPEAQPGSARRARGIRGAASGGDLKSRADEPAEPAGCDPARSVPAHRRPAVPAHRGRDHARGTRRHVGALPPRFRLRQGNRPQRAMSEPGREDWVSVARRADLATGAMIGVAFGDYQIALHDVAGEVVATDNLCTHANAVLSDGTLQAEIVAC